MADVPTKNRGGRPVGAKTNPAKKAAAAAARERRRAAQDANVPTDDLVSAVAASVPPLPPNSGGRPSVDERGRTRLASQLTAAYEGMGALVATGGAALGRLNPTLAGRLTAVGRELQSNAERCGIALARWADTNPRVKQWLANLSTGSGMLLVLAAHAPIIAAAAGYGDVAPLVGVVADDVASGGGADLLKILGTVFTPAPAPPAATVSDPAPAATAA